MRQALFSQADVVVSLTYIFLPLILGFVHAKMKRRSIADILLSYYLFISVGIQGLVTGIAESTHPEIVTAYVHLPFSPFLLELGMANASYGVLGILSPWRSMGWKGATALGYGLFLLISGTAHCINMMHQGSLPENSGAFLWCDLIIPLVLLILWRGQSTKNKKENRGFYV